MTALWGIGNTVPDGEWGDGKHLALACKVYGVRDEVIGSFDYTFGIKGPLWTAR